MTASPIDVPKLELCSVIGFEGSLNRGLLIHPDQQHMVYALGCNVIVRNISTDKVDILWGHNKNVSCLAISKSGRYIASGEVTHMGFKADICLWDFESRQLECRFTLHKVKVEALTFSPNDKYLLSLGGRDDGSVVVWNVAKREAICGSPAQTKSAGFTTCIAYANNSDNIFVTAGEGTLRVWELDVENRKIRPTDVRIGQINRIVLCLEIAEDDCFAYCGTTTGDILAINMTTKLLQFIGPEKKKFCQGIRDLALMRNGEILIGAGDGTVAVIQGMESKFKRTCKHANVAGAVTSIALRGSGHQFFIGTSKSHIYRFSFAEFKIELLNTYHNTKINDVAFGYGLSDLFVTCSYEDVRIWHLSKSKELLRITVANKECNTVLLPMNGSSIITGWNDSTIRAFTPQSGKLLYEVENAGKNGVTALAVNSDCSQIISGDGDGTVRVWNIRKVYKSKGCYEYLTPELVKNLKEHTASVTAIKIEKDDECVTSSTDGTCIIWDLKDGRRKQMLRANTLFQNVVYHATGSQLVTCGTDRKIAYWETFDGSVIRELEGSKAGSINGLDISPLGDFFVSGDDDKLVKVWSYDQGEVIAVGIGHSGSIKKVKISPPNGEYIVSVSEDGAILVWRFPFSSSQTTEQ